MGGGVPWDRRFPTGHASDAGGKPAVPGSSLPIPAAPAHRAGSRARLGGGRGAHAMTVAEQHADPARVAAVVDLVRAAIAPLALAAGGDGVAEHGHRLAIADAVEHEDAVAVAARPRAHAIEFDVHLVALRHL